jgi:hypothetical protein
VIRLKSKFNNKQAWLSGAPAFSAGEDIKKISRYHQFAILSLAHTTINKSPFIHISSRHGQLAAGLGYRSRLRLFIITFIIVKLGIPHHQLA